MVNNDGCRLAIIVDYCCAIGGYGQTLKHRRKKKKSPGFTTKLNWMSQNES